MVLGAGPAGLGAALALARDGADVTVLEAADGVGGLCRTIRANGLSYDIGGHILFVDRPDRPAWLRELLGDDAIWVDRPVVSVDGGGRIVPGRYLDRRPAVGPTLDERSGAPAGSAAEFLGDLVGRPFTDAEMRPYLEKVDGMPLERIPGERARKLLVEQAAPDGFWYAAGGVGQLMDSMADEVRRHGGTVSLNTPITRIERGPATVDVYTDPTGPAISAAELVVAIPPAAAARMFEPPPGRQVIPALPPRAAALVYLVVDQPNLTEHAWIQVDDPGVPFARMFEPRRWSERLVTGDRTVVGCECYCHPSDDDPLWALSDAALSALCAAALRSPPLELVGPETRVSPLQVVRLPRAWSLVDADHVATATAPWRWLEELPRVTVAQGGDVTRAIGAGEAAATRVASLR